MTTIIACGQFASLIVFPELAVSGYLRGGELRAIAIRPSGPEVASLQGTALDQPLCGASAIVDPHGGVLARAGEGTAKVIAARYDDEAVESFRARLPLLQHRRPDAYA